MRDIFAVYVAVFLAILVASPEKVGVWSGKAYKAFEVEYSAINYIENVK